METPLRILYLEDDPKDAELVQEMLETEFTIGHVKRVENQSDFRALVEKCDFNIILADYTLPSFDGLSALRIIQEKCLEIPFIFVSGTLGEEVAIEALKSGATDYVLKDRMSRIVPSVRRALREAEEITERKQAEEALRESHAQLSKKNRYESIVSKVTRSVHQSINLREVLENAVEEMIKNMDKVEQVSIYLIEEKEEDSNHQDQNSQYAVIRAYRGYPDWFIKQAGRIPYPKGSTWKTIIEKTSIYCADIDQDTAIGPAGRKLGMKSYLATPIFFDDKAVGALHITSRRKDAFNEDEINLVEIVARQIGTAINNAQKAEALQKALTEVEQLKNRLMAENVYLKEEIKTEYNFEEIIGESDSLKSVIRQVQKVAPTEVTILIMGETGTGKELFARAIHNLSPRRDRPLVKVNCGAISAGLVESELFGHEKGAFTGAVQQRIGRFELADGGTIFLDEVSELPLDTQVKLLRVLQEGEFERVGNSKPIKVDVRVIAATNRNLKEAVEDGSFRKDLFYRLSVLPLRVPPLRERRSDIPLLANFFLAKFAKATGKQITGISDQTLEQLKAYHWPGNVRELQNAIERAVVLAQEPTTEISEPVFDMNQGLESPDSEMLEDIERTHILRVLEKANWVIQGEQGAAQVLGLNPSTLRFRMKKLGIKKQ